MRLSAEDLSLWARVEGQGGQSFVAVNRDQQVVLDAALDINRLQEQLQGPDSLKLAAWFKTTAAQGIKEFTARKQRQQQLPTELPKPLPNQKELRRNKKTGKVLLGREKAEQDARKREAAEKKARKAVGVAQEEVEGEEMGVLAAVAAAVAAPEAVAMPKEGLAMMMEMSDDEYISNNDFGSEHRLTRSIFKPSENVFGLQRHTLSPPSYSPITQPQLPLASPSPPSYSPITQPQLPLASLLDSPSFSLQDLSPSFNTSPLTIRGRRDNTQHGWWRDQSPCLGGSNIQLGRQDQSPCPGGSNIQPSQQAQSVRAGDSDPQCGERAHCPGPSTSNPQVISPSFFFLSEGSPPAHLSGGKRARKPSRKVFSQQEREREAAAARAKEPRGRKRRTHEAKEETDREAKRLRADKEAAKRERREREAQGKEVPRVAREAERDEKRARKVTEAEAARARRAAEKAATDQRREEARRREAEERTATRAAKEWQQRLQKAASKGEPPKEDVSQPWLEPIVID